jgi:hypothetical protein
MTFQGFVAPQIALIQSRATADSGVKIKPVKQGANTQ